MQTRNTRVGGGTGPRSVRPRRRLPLAFAFVGLLLSFSATTVISQELPEPRGFVNDYAGVIDESTEREMTALSEAVQDATATVHEEWSLPPVE